MKHIQIGDISLSIYDSINNIPPARESLMNYYLMADAGIGHSFQDVDSHLSSITMAALYGKKEDLIQHIENLKLNFMTIASQYNPKYMGWLCLIDEVDGKKFTDTSEDGLSELGKRISEQITDGFDFSECLSIIKKKFPTSWQSIFQAGEPELTEE